MIHDPVTPYVITLSLINQLASYDFIRESVLYILRISYIYCTCVVLIYLTLEGDNISFLLVSFNCPRINITSLYNFNVKLKIARNIK